ncbi:MAG: response regulator transcription factor [Roseiflexaceae bacterium]|jgi:two-component system KDP operon response regulator KdpE|nr:response regulator transcription factor [Chloroflexaceae bacterium]
MTQSQLIMVVDDEPGLRRLLNLLFSNAGYRVIESSSGPDCLAQLASHSPDLIVLDIMMPDMDGREVCQQLRNAKNMVPVLMLTARTQSRDIVMGLDCGADDYMLKPFDMDELLARVRALLRRSNTAQHTRIVGAGELVIDTHTRKVTVKGVEVELTPTEYALLSVLAENAGNVVPHESLLHSVWGPNSQHDQDYLKVYMWHLRRKIEPNAGRSPRLLLTEWGVGYRLVQ